MFIKSDLDKPPTDYQVDKAERTQVLVARQT